MSLQSSIIASSYRNAVETTASIYKLYENISGFVPTNLEKLEDALAIILNGVKDLHKEFEKTNFVPPYKTIVSVLDSEYYDKVARIIYEHGVKDKPFVETASGTIPVMNFFKHTTFTIMFIDKNEINGLIYECVYDAMKQMYNGITPPKDKYELIPAVLTYVEFINTIQNNSLYARFMRFIGLERWLFRRTKKFYTRYIGGK